MACKRSYLILGSEYLTDLFQTIGRLKDEGYSLRELSSLLRSMTPGDREVVGESIVMCVNIPQSHEDGP